MNILIIGHAGYVGPVLVDQLLKNKDYNLKGIDTEYFKKKDLFKNKKYKNLKNVFKDVIKISQIDLKNIDAIVYLAAISNDPMGNKFQKITFEINYKSALKIANLAKKMVLENLFLRQVVVCMVLHRAYLKQKNQN